MLVLKWIQKKKKKNGRVAENPYGVHMSVSRNLVFYL